MLFNKTVIILSFMRQILRIKKTIKINLTRLKTNKKTILANY